MNQRSNCQHPLYCRESKRVPEKVPTTASLTMLIHLTVWITTNYGKFWKRWEYHTTLLTCLLRNLCTGQEATVRTGLATTSWLQIRKGVCQGCVLSPCLFNFPAEYIIRNARLDEAQSGIKISGRNINNLRYADDVEISITSDRQMALWQKAKKN